MTCSDNQVRKLMKTYVKTKSAPKAALKAGMDAKTANKWLKNGCLPSEKPKKNRDWRTRQNPFSDVWPEIEGKINNGSKAQIKDLFEYLCDKYPNKWQPNQLRTLQRLVKNWKIINGPDKIAYLEQDHHPGEALQADFSEIESLNIKIQDELFCYMIFHSVLPYSNWEWVTVCKSESLIALKRGFQESLKELGAKPKFFQTDNSTSATHKVSKKEQLIAFPKKQKRAFNLDYIHFCRGYDITPRTTEVAEKQQNGDIESSHNQFKKAVASALEIMGTSDFKSVDELEQWLQKLARKRNLSEKRQLLLLDEKKHMAVFKGANQKDYKEILIKVSKFSNIVINRNVYSVPSRLIGQIVTVRQHEWHIEIYYQNKLQIKTASLIGSRQHTINYKHVIWSLISKPGAFACYRYRDEMFPRIIFRRAYDFITQEENSTKKDLEYLRILHLAASNSEEDVALALELLFEQKSPISYENVKNLVEIKKPNTQLQMAEYKPELKVYDKLLAGAGL